MFDRRTPLPPRRRPLKRTALARGGRIRVRSRKTARLYRTQRTPLNRELETAPRGCVAGPLLAEHGIDVCTGRATAWHERRKRSAGGSIVDAANTVPVCSACNHAVEMFPLEAWAAGLVVREGDRDWESLSKRCDRA